jgi:hypothetical protein
MIFTLLGVFASIAAILTGNGEPLEDMLDLVPVPEAFRSSLLGLLAVDFVIATFMENIMRFLFPSRPNTRLLALHLPKGGGGARSLSVKAESKKTK